jgi:aminoglycoside phosphotransferase (APT) family kinase protein
MRQAGSVGAKAEVSDLVALPGGFSRRMYRADVVDPPDEDFGVIVCVRGSDSLLASSLEQEYGIYEVLKDVTVATPRVHGKCTAPDNPVGGAFFVMDRLPGEAPNVWRATDRERLEKNWRTSRGVATDMVAMLAAIHQTDVAPLRSFVKRLNFEQVVASWKKSYEEVRLIRDPIVDEAYEWVLERVPEPVGEHLVHGDFRIGNCLVHEGRVTGVLDWELAYLGDPRFDLGYLALVYSAGKLFRSGSGLMGAFAERQWFWDRYTALTGMPVDPDVVLTFSVLSALMLVANLSSGVHTFAKRGADDLRMLWSRLPIMSIRQDLVHMMGWPSGRGS